MPLVAAQLKLGGATDFSGHVGTYQEMVFGALLTLAAARGDAWVNSSARGAPMSTRRYPSGLIFPSVQTAIQRTVQAGTTNGGDLLLDGPA
jgi:hypothetical protein